MDKMNTRIRNYRSEDREALVRFWTEVVKMEETHERPLIRELTDNLDRPNHFPGKNLFIAENMGNIIGHIDVFPETDIGRVVVQCLVHPEYRRKGIAENKAGKRLFSKMGFRFVRRYLELGLDLSKVRLSKIKRNDYPCRPMNQGEEEKLTRLQNRSFMDTWGFNPNTMEDIIYRIHLSVASFKDIILCLDGAKPIGYCWSKIYEDDDKVLYGTRARINMLGVDPDYRGKGVGKKVLLNGLIQLKGRGVRHVILTVDNENKVARSLYQSVGFKPRTSSLWYQKDL